MRIKITVFSLFIVLCTESGRCQAGYPGMAKWNQPFTAGGAVTGSPAVGPGGSPIYVTAEDGYLYAIDPTTGTTATNWPQPGVYVGDLPSFYNSNELISSPAVDANGNIYIVVDVYIGVDNLTNYAHFLEIVSPGGYVFPPVPFPPSELDSVGAVAIAPNGMAYVTFDDDINLYAVNVADPAAASIQWTLYVGITDSPPTVGPDGTVYFYSTGDAYGNDEAIVAVQDETCRGAIKWKADLGGFIEDVNDFASSLVVDNSGHIYAPYGPNANGLQAFNTTNGSPVSGAWPFMTPDEAKIVDSPAIGTNGTIYIGASDGILYALNTNGSLKWQFNTESGTPIRSSPAVTSDNSITFGTDGGRIWNVMDFGSQGAMLWSYPDVLNQPALTGPIVSSPLIAGADNAVYFGCGNSNVYAVYGAAPLTNTASPMFRGNPQHTAAPASPPDEPAWWLDVQVSGPTSIYKGLTGLSFPRGGQTSFVITRSSCTASVNSSLLVTFFLGSNGTAYSTTNYAHIPFDAYYELDFSETGANTAPFANGFNVTFAPGQTQATVTVNTIDSPSGVASQMLTLELVPGSNYQPSPDALTAVVTEFPDPKKH